MSEQKKQLAGSLIALGATITDAMDDVPGFLPCGTPAQVILNAINVYSNGDDATALETSQNVLGFIGHVSEHRGVTAHEMADVDALTSEQSQLAAKVLELAQADANSLDPVKTEWLYRSLAALEPGNGNAATLLAQA